MYVGTGPVCSVVMWLCDRRAWCRAMRRCQSRVVVVVVDGWPVQTISVSWNATVSPMLLMTLLYVIIVIVVVVVVVLSVGSLSSGYYLDGSLASNPEQVANLLCAQANSASYPQRDGKWVVAYGLRGEGLLWLIGAVVCLLAATCGSSCSLMQAMDGRILRCGILSPCQSAATSEIVKALLVAYSCKKRCSKYQTFIVLPLWVTVCEQVNHLGNLGISSAKVNSRLPSLQIRWIEYQLAWLESRWGSFTCSGGT